MPSIRAMPANRRRFSETQIANALRANYGSQAGAARALEQACGVPVSRQSINDRCKRSPRLQAVVAETTEEILDLAESAVVQSISHGDLKAAQFILRTRGKSRGYSYYDRVVTARTDPRTLSDAELDEALQRLEAEACAQGLTIDAEPAAPLRVLPGPVKRSRG